MRVIISGGGTGGHINPALAIAGKIEKECPSAVIEYVGTEKGLETALVPKAGYKIHYVKVKGFKRKLSAENISAFIQAFTSVMEAKKIIKSFRPDIVIGTGGYVCWPVLKAAADMKIPTAVHESNAIPGVATKMLSKHVDRILVNFDETRKKLDVPDEKIITVGNPVRGELFTLSKSESRKKEGIGEDKKVLLSYGGSLGAAMINSTVFEMIEKKMLPDEYIHIHATGSRYWEEAKERFMPLGFSENGDEEIVRGNTRIRKYIYNMPVMLACADTVICRAGAMTVSEVSAMGKTPIMIPSPNVAENHQYKNALVLQKAGAAELIEEKDLSAQKLAAMTTELMSDTERTKAMNNKIRKFADPKCLDKIYLVIKQLTDK